MCLPPFLYRGTYWKIDLSLSFTQLFSMGTSRDRAMTMSGNRSDETGDQLDQMRNDENKTLSGTVRRSGGRSSGAGRSAAAGGASRSNEVSVGGQAAAKSGIGVGSASDPTVLKAIVTQQSSSSHGDGRSSCSSGMPQFLQQLSSHSSTRSEANAIWPVQRHCRIPICPKTETRSSKSTALTDCRRRITPRE